MQRFVGLMSGTSADGVDAVVARFDQGRFLGIDAAFHLPHPPSLQSALIALGRDAKAQVILSALVALDITIAEQFAAAAQAVIEAAGLTAADICAIGSHGQTVFHAPKSFKSSLQLGDPNRIAALTGVAVVADFRRMDVALGGEGAPLVPAFHQAVFASATPTVVVNIGGIANVTLLPARADQATTGYDCGPGNALMDEWAVRHLGSPYDLGGRWSAQGHILPELLACWLSDPYFDQAPPKSTGRDLFNLDWAVARCASTLDAFRPVDVQATLCELTARTICASVPPDTLRVLICGGGAFNSQLMQRIAALLPQAEVSSTEVADLPPQWVEAAAFAWLAHQKIHGLPGNLPSVTGASRPAVLGGLYG